MENNTVSYYPADRRILPGNSSNIRDIPFADKPEYSGISPVLAVLVANTAPFGSRTALNMLSDIYPFVSPADQKQIENVLGFTNSVNRSSGLNGSYNKTYMLKKALTESQKLSGLFSVLGKYGGTKSAYTLRTVKSLLETKNALQNDSSPASVIGQLMKNTALMGMQNRAFNGMDMGNIISMLSGFKNGGSVPNLASLFSMIK